MRKKLTAAQVAALAPYERYFKQAVEAAWCSYPGQAAIDNMKAIWEDLTGHAYPYKAGCPNCLLNLVRDMGTLYFAAVEDNTPAKAANFAAEPKTPAKGTTTPAKKKTAKKGKK